ncbi:MAG: proprotein convertase P-domain-containing protein, partial [Planctomycetota bacterium]|nr:proprotein convertase P-domain-containing protein [Planctomycetota bacterium]
MTIDDLDVRLTIDHRNLDDLDIFLRSPDGTLIELSTDNGADGNTYLSTIFDDEATIAIDDVAASPPFFGRHRPEAALNVFDGTDAIGTWQLQVTDDTIGGLDATLLFWELRINENLDPQLTITGPGGELATNDDALNGVLDSAIVDVVVPTTGSYTFTVNRISDTIGSFTLEAGIYESTVPLETEPTTNLDPLRVAGGNVAVRGIGNGVAATDVYTATLVAGEAVTLAATTPGGFYGPGLQVSGPGGFSTSDALFQSGPGFDSVLLFTAPETAIYTFTVDYPPGADFANVISTGSYALSLAISDNANNNSIPNARPISAFDYRNPVETTSLVYNLTGVEGLWRGEIDAASDVDFFHLGQLEAGELIRMTVQREGASQLFPFTLLANSAGQVIGGAQSLRFDPVSGVAVFERIISQADDYYLVVGPEPVTVGAPTLSTGPYLLFYSSFPSVEDAYEQNDSKAEVDAAASGAVNSPNLGTVGEVTVISDLAMMEDSEDWFRFDTATTGVRGDYVRILFDHSEGNLNLEVLDDSGTVIRRSQTVSDNERVSFQGLPAGTYYARVYGNGGARNPAYSLRIQIGSPDHRLLSAPFTTDAQYTLNYQLTGVAASSSEQLQEGENVLIVITPSSGPGPFELLFDVTRVGSMADQTRTQYDLLGNPSRETDALGRDTTYIYDDLGRLLVVDGPQIGDASGYTYDGNDNLIQVTDTAFGAGTTGYTYDALDRLRTITLPGSLGTIGYTYDLTDRVTSITYPDSTLVSYTYDAAGRLKTVTEGTDVTTYTYYPDGLMKTVTLPNNITSTYTYDVYGRITDLVYTNTVPEVVTGFHYTLDANGNRTGVDIERSGITSSYVYGYDALDRLVTAEYPDGQVVTYTYDDNGNRLSTSIDPDGTGAAVAVVETYHYGQDNRLESITDDLGNPVKEFFYDPRGNVVMMVTPTDTVHYEYDYRNLLTAVEDGTNRIEYIYDGNGDRIAKVVNGERTTFVNDPNREFTQVLLELDDAGAVEASYTYGDGRIRGLLPGETNPAYYIIDAIGSTSDLTNSSASVLQSYSYDAFGSTRVVDAGGVAASVTNEFLFAGERIEHETDFSFNRARYYDPATGRFQAKDPSGFFDCFRSVSCLSWMVPIGYAASSG